MKNVKTILPVLLMLFLAPSLHSQIQPRFKWAAKFGGIKNVRVTAIATDTAGNVYTTGYFNNTVDFDPGPDSFYLDCSDSADIFILKTDSNGKFLWARQIGSRSLDLASSLAIDQAGNVWVTGYFSGTADFDPGAGHYMLTAYGAADLFLLKLNPQGQFLWARQAGGPINDIGTSLFAGANGNIYLGGAYTDSADFRFDTVTHHLVSAGKFDCFEARLDTSGKIIWIKSLGGKAQDGITAIEADAKGNVYAAGTFEDTVDFNPGSSPFKLQSKGDEDCFILKLDSQGNFQWALDYGDSIRNFPQALALDPEGNNAYIGVNQRHHFYILKVSSQGKLQWEQQILDTSSLNTCYGAAICTDNHGYVYSTGYVEN